MTKIHASAVVDKTVELGADVFIGPNCVIESGAIIGDGTVLDANIFIGKNTKMGKNNKVYPFAAIGTAPQILAMGTDSAVGSLEIGDNNQFREQVTIHPSMHENGKTVIGDENFLMIGVHIGHDCLLEDKIVMSNYTQLSGHCKIETGVWLSGNVLLHQFVTIGRWSYAAGLAGINHDVPPFVIISGHYPLSVRGINKRGLSRCGLDEVSQKAIMSTFKKLYRNDGSLVKNAKAIASEPDLDPNARDMVDAILKGNEHRFGRYLEQFRD